MKPVTAEEAIQARRAFAAGNQISPQLARGVLALGGEMTLQEYESLARVAESDIDPTQKMANRVANAVHHDYDTRSRLDSKATAMSGYIEQEPSFFIVDKDTGTRYMVVVMEWDSQPGENHAS